MTLEVEYVDVGGRVTRQGLLTTIISDELVNIRLHRELYRALAAIAADLDA